MADVITLQKSWCNEHLAQCWHSYNNQTGMTKHLGDIESIEPAGTVAFSQEMQRLEELGYSASHTYPSYTLTRYKSQPLALPLDWQMAIEERPEYVDVDQDW